MGMLQGAPQPPTNGLQRFVTAGNLACCLGDQWLCAPAQMNSFSCLTVIKDETLNGGEESRFTQISGFSAVWVQY